VAALGNVINDFYDHWHFYGYKEALEI